MFRLNLFVSSVSRDFGLLTNTGKEILDSFQMGFNILLQETPWESLPSEAVCRRLGRVEEILVSNYLFSILCSPASLLMLRKNSKFQFQRELVLT